MAEVQLDAGVFWGRAQRLHAAWTAGREAEGSVWHGVDAIAVLLGKLTSDGSVDTLPTLLHMYLFEVVLGNTLIVLTADAVVIMCAAKKARLLEPLAQAAPAGLSLKIATLEKDNLDARAEEAVAMARGSFAGTRVGTLDEDKAEGSLQDAWASQSAAAALTSTSVSSGVRAAMMAKDEAERKLETQAAAIAVAALQRVFVKRMEHAFENEKPMTHAAAAAAISKALLAPAGKPLKLANVTADDVELAFPPQVQSGGVYSFEPGSDAGTGAKPMSSDIIVCQVAVKFRDYHALCGRTFLVNPTRSQKRVYAAAVKAFEVAQSNLKPGVALGDVYDAAAAALAAEAADSGVADVAQRLSASMGHGTGLEWRNADFEIRHGNAQTAQPGMTFAVSVALTDLALPASERPSKASAPQGALLDGKYAVLLSGTLALPVGAGAAGAAQDLTGAMDAKLTDMEYEMDGNSDDDDEEEEEEEDDEARVQDIVNRAGGRQRVTRSKTKSREELAEEARVMSLQQKMLDAQDSLMKQKAADALRQLERNQAKKKKKKKATKGKKRDDENDDDDDDDENDDENDDDEENDDENDEEVLQAYASPDDYPPDLQRNKIYCDREKESVLLPLGGVHVPFHISAIKGVAKTDEETATLLRFSFFYPTGGATFARDVTGTMRSVMSRYPALNYVKELSFRSRDARNLTDQFRAIKELQKKVRAKQRLLEQEADLVDQVELVHVPRGSGERPPQLTGVSMRPALGKGKSQGTLTAHVNGLRFMSDKNRETFDIIYANVKHFFFYEAKNDLAVIIHFQFKHPVMIGRAKTLYAQFYTEVTESSAALDGRRRNGYDDPDEQAEERRDLELKRRLNKMFRTFCAGVVKQAEAHGQRIGPDNDFDVPFRKLAFVGVPLKEMVTLMPTVHTLVNLTDSPPFVLTLDDIEHVHFERVNQRTRNFDMTFILKQHMAPNAGLPVRVTNIDTQSLAMIQKWLHDKGDITYTVGTSALNWKAVMEGVYEELDRGVFWAAADEDGVKKDVGWNFLKVEDEEEAGEEDGGEAQKDGDSDFDAASDAEEEEEESSDDDDDEVEEEDSSDADEEDEEEGEDWDELEKTAEEDDKKRSRKERERAEEDNGNSRKRSRRS